MAAANQFLVIAITDRNIVLITARSFTSHPTKIFARLPLQTRLGPVNHRADWSHINCQAAFAMDIKTWVPLKAYGLVDAHDKSLSPGIT